MVMPKEFLLEVLAKRKILLAQHLAHLLVICFNQWYKDILFLPQKNNDQHSVQNLWIIHDAICWFSSIREQTNSDTSAQNFDTTNMNQEEHDHL